MHRIFILGALGALVAACAPDIYDRPGATQEQFNVDMGGCQMFAMGIPQVQPQYVPPSYTANTTYSGTYTGTRTMGSLDGQASTYVQPDNSGQAMANLGASLANAGRQRNAIRSCMAAHGYSLRQ